MEGEALEALERIRKKASLNGINQTIRYVLVKYSRAMIKEDKLERTKEDLENKISALEERIDRLEGLRQKRQNNTNKEDNIDELLG